MAISCEKLQQKMFKFPKKYHNDFDSFWNWKNEKESKGQNIIGDELIDVTYVKLGRILSSWQAYRRPKNDDPLTKLRESLYNIREPFKKIKQYDLTQFGDIPVDSMREIWHELGRVKEYEGSRNLRGRYNVIAVCKPLMLLWGQTMAFDSNVRYNISGMNIRVDQYIWNFEKWYDAMTHFSDIIKANIEVKECIKKISYEKYGKYQVPYGRFLDIYFFMG